MSRFPFGLNIITARTAADVNRVSSTTFANDTGLCFAIQANETYEVDVTYVLTNHAGAFKTCVTVPAGATILYSGVFNDDGGGTHGGWTASASTSPLGGLVGSGQAAVARMNLHIANGATAGVVQFQSAQVISDVNATVVKAGTMLIATCTNGA